MTIIEWLLFGTFMVLIITSLWIHDLKLKNKKMRMQEQDNLHPELIATPYTFEECKDVLDTVIADVVVDLELRYTINEVKIVRNVQQDVVACSKEVFSLLSPNIYNQLQYHVTEKYIMQYVSRNVKSFILGYMKQKNTGA